MPSIFSKITLSKRDNEDAPSTPSVISSDVNLHFDPDPQDKGSLIVTMVPESDLLSRTEIGKIPADATPAQAEAECRRCWGEAVTLAAGQGLQPQQHLPEIVDQTVKALNAHREAGATKGSGQGGASAS